MNDLEKQVGESREKNHLGLWENCNDVGLGSEVLGENAQPVGLFVKWEPWGLIQSVDRTKWKAAGKLWVVRPSNWESRYSGELALAFL